MTPKAGDVKQEATKGATPERREALLASIVESTDDAIISKDLNGIILTWNGAAGRMFGYSADEIVGTSIRRLIPEDLQHEEEAILAKIRSGDRLTHYETVRLRKNGERFHVSITVSPLADAEGKIIGASKIAREITERKRLEKQIIQSEKLAATARMAATVAHEVNNPLASVLNLLYLARTSESLPEAQSFVSTAEIEIERVSHIARQSLGYYRDDGTPSPVKVQEVVEHVLSVYQGKLTSAGITVERQYGDHPLVTVSQGELMQVFANLIANAIDAMQQGGTLWVQVHQRLEPDGIEIVFRDSGHGIEKSNLDHVFEPFFTTKGNVGTGIGLWVVKQLIERRGGEIHLVSSTEAATSGTAVTLFLPLATPTGVQRRAVN